MNWFPYVESVRGLRNCSKLLISGSRVRWQSNTQQLHQITTNKCGNLTVSQVILTISQYKIYHEMNRKIIHKVSILSSAETHFRNFAMPKGNIGHFPCEHWSIQWHKNIFWEFWFVKIYFDNFDWKVIILVREKSGLKKGVLNYIIFSSSLGFDFLVLRGSLPTPGVFFIGSFRLR